MTIQRAYNIRKFFFYLIFITWSQSPISQFLDALPVYEKNQFQTLQVKNKYYKKKFLKEMAYVSQSKKRINLISLLFCLFYTMQKYSVIYILFFPFMCAFLFCKKHKNKKTQKHKPYCIVSFCFDLFLFIVENLFILVKINID